MRYLTLFLFILIGTLRTQTQDDMTVPRTDDDHEHHKGGNTAWFFGITTAAVATTTAEQIKSDQPWTVGTPPLFTGITMVKGNLGVTPFYNFGTNSAGLFLTYVLHDHIGAYLVADKQLNLNNGFYGIGFTSPLYEDIALAFVEVGQDYQKTIDPLFSVGMYISFNKLLKGPKMDMSFIL